MYAFDALDRRQRVSSWDTFNRRGPVLPLVLVLMLVLVLVLASGRGIL